MDGPTLEALKKGSGTICAKHPSGRAGKWCLTPFLGPSRRFVLRTRLGKPTAVVEDVPQLAEPHAVAVEQILQTKVTVQCLAALIFELLDQVGDHRRVC